MTALSIVIPVTHDSRYLNQTINSVTDQSLKDIEIIPVVFKSCIKSRAFLEKALSGDSKWKKK